MIDTSVSLLDRIVTRGETDDWERLLDVYRPFIERQVHKYPQLVSHFDDIVQEIALVMMQELPKFQRERTGSFRKWLRIVTVHQLQSASRKLRASPMLVEDWSQFESELMELENPASIAAKRWDEEHDREVAQRVKHIVRQEVGETNWKAFVMHGLERVSAAETADRLGITQNMVYIATSRVEKRLKIEGAGLTGPD